MDEFALIKALKANKQISEMTKNNTKYLHAVILSGSNYAFSFDVLLNVKTEIKDITTLSNVLGGMQLSCTGFYNPSSVVQSHAYLIDTTSDVYSAYFIKCISTNGQSVVKFAELGQMTFTDHVQLVDV